jgi:hypothetical protein
MSNAAQSTIPKPFIFVLMPIDKKFDDIYKFGIKGAAEDVGAYAERLDEQIFVEGMLDRIFNQISKADLIIADMTGRNPNVFYEVGYAHALGKITLLLTQDADDIPFDLKHRQHTVYGGSIDLLRKELADRLRWGIAESRRQGRGPSTERLSVRILDIDVPRTGESKDPPTISGTINFRSFVLPVRIRNDSFDALPGITHVYLFTDEKAGVIPCKYEYASVSVNWSPYWSSSVGIEPTGGTSITPVGTPIPIEQFKADTVDAPDDFFHQFRLPAAVPAFPPGAVEAINIDLMFKEGIDSSNAGYRLRLHTPSQYHDFSFRLNISYKAPSPVDSPNKSKESTK